MIETKLYGKNLCNLLSNQCIQYFDEIDSNHKTKIKVVYVDKFFILTGLTSISNPVNFSSIFRNYLINNFNYDYVINVIDFIEYNKPYESSITSVNVSLNSLKELSFDYMDGKIQGYVSINDTQRLIKYNNRNLFDTFISENQNIIDYKSIYEPVLISTESDELFGMSLCMTKIYTVFLKYISYNLIDRNIMSDIELNLIYEGEPENISWETIDLSVKSKNCIVSLKWLKSLILDVFDFSLSSVLSELEIENYNFENEILLKDRIWEKRGKAGEIILY